MNIVNTHILMVLMFIGTTTQAPLSGESFQQLIPSTDPVNLEIEGLIVDATQTKIGRDFYEMFFNRWNPADYLPKLQIVINERPLPRLGTQVAISIDDNVIYQRFVQPRADQLEQNVNLAIQVANRYLENYELIQKQLQGDDLAGTGIY